MKIDQKISTLARPLGPRSWVFAPIFSLIILCQLSAALAQEKAERSSDDYAAAYSEGIQNYSEGDFKEAVDSLLRAYALDPQPSTLRMVVRAYDEMGFCDAAMRQKEVLETVHPEADEPNLRRCADSGAVKLQCADKDGAVFGGRVLVDGKFSVECGQTISLAPGAHRLLPEPATRVRAPDREAARALRDAAQTVEVDAGELTEITLTFVAPPIRWKLADEPEVSVLTDLAVRVERLEANLPEYTVYLTDDGLYRVLLRPQSSSMRPSARPLTSPRPEVLRLCDSGERFDDQLYRCVPIKKMHVPKFD